MWAPTAANDSNKITKVQLYLYASNLRKAGVFHHGAPDPFAVVTLLSNNPTVQPRILGKTEVVKNTAGPKWTSTFLIDYEFGQPTRINVGVYDEEKRGRNNKPLGSALFEIGEILAARGNTKAKTLKNGGTIFARVLRPPEIDAGTLNLTLRGVQLKNLDGIFGKSDPFFEISAQADSAGGLTWQPVYRSQPVMNNLNPTWPSASINVNTLCNGDKNKPILVAVKDWEQNGAHKQMGSFETTVNGLLGAVVAGGYCKTVDASRAFSLTTRGKHFGKIVVTEASIVGGSNFQSGGAPGQAAYGYGSATMPPPSYGGGDFSQALNQPPPAMISAVTGYAPTNVVTPLPPPLAPPTLRPKFVDYLSGGCELQMCVAIDFTGSNGDPRRPGTLHYIHQDGQLNDYEKALTAVGSIIARYDSDQRFPVWGFGAKFGGVIQHCFQVGPTAELNGIRGILEGYRNVFKTGLTMSGPTVFAEVIDVAAAQARSKQDAASRIGKQAYSILLILTDGAVTDVNLTKQSIIAASTAPLSIVIVGIGHADFSAMQFLDDVANSPGSGRDICQFVEFSKHQYDKTTLTRETLAEIPDQVVEYFYGHGIKPLPPISGSLMSIVPDECNDDEDIDLSVEHHENGQVTLAHTGGAIYDDTQYGTLADHMGSTTSRPPFRPAGVGPSAPSAPYVPAGGPTVVQGGSYNPNAPTVPSQQYAYQQDGQQGAYRPSGSQHSSYHSPQENAYQPNGSLHSSYHPPQQNAYHPGGGQPGGAPPYQPSQPNVYNSQGGSAHAGSAPAKVFNVQVPPGCGPGMQLQVVNPTTQQSQIVTIPQGVPPGGVFPVHY